jgi:hypothetical protein
MIHKIIRNKKLNQTQVVYIKQKKHRKKFVGYTNAESWFDSFHYLDYTKRLYVPHIYKDKYIAASHGHYMTNKVRITIEEI